MKRWSPGLTAPAGAHPIADINFQPSESGLLQPQSSGPRWWHADQRRAVPANTCLCYRILSKCEFCGFKPTKFWGVLQGNRKDCFSSEFWLKFCFLIVCLLHILWWDFPVGSDCKESICKAGGPGSIPGSGISPGEGNGYLPQYSCLGNPMARGTWRATVHEVSKGWTRLIHILVIILSWPISICLHRSTKGIKIPRNFFDIWSIAVALVH